MNSDTQEIKSLLRLMQSAINQLQNVTNQIQNDLKDMKDVQEKRILPSVIFIEKYIKGYGDAYKENNRNMKKLEKRVEVLEQNSNIKILPELKLADVA